MDLCGLTRYWGSGLEMFQVEDNKRNTITISILRFPLKPDFGVVNSWGDFDAINPML